MKDNFDLRKYLVENKMTENSRGNKRHHLTESVVLNTKILSEAGYVDQDLDLDQLSDEDFDPQEALAAYDAAMQDMGIEGGETEGSGVNFEDPEDLSDEELDECGDMSMELDEASYVDDDDDDFARDLDFTAGDALAAKIGGRQAKKLADRSIGQEFSDDDEELTRSSSSDSEDDDVPTRGKTYKPGDWVKEMKSWGHGISWEDVDFVMDDEELNRYLGSFNRPNVAARFLAEKLRSCQKEVDYGPRKKMYFILKNDGYYGLSNFIGAQNQTRFIATIYKNEENSKKYYDED